MPGETAHSTPAAVTAGPALTGFVAGLSEARGAQAAAECLAEHLARLEPGAAVRVYVLGPGDRCATCLRAKECSWRERCFHLAAGAGSFAQPPGHAERIPRHGNGWGDATDEPGTGRRSAPPAELAAPGARADDATALFLPLRAGGVTLGVAGLRLPPSPPAGFEETAAQATFLTGAAVGAALSRAEERQRFEQLLLVNEIGRKVNSILNLDLLMRQAVVDIQRTFGYRHVSLFTVDRETRRVSLMAQSSAYPRPDPGDHSIDIGQGVVGRVARGGSTVRVDDVSREADYVNWWPDTKSEVAVPVRIGGVVEAVVNVESDVADAFGEADVVVLETAAHQLAIAMENARLFGRVKESEEEYRALVESAPIAVLQIDTEGRVAYANRAVTDLTGLDRATAISRLANPVDFAVPEDRPRLAAALAAAAAGEARRGVEFRATHTDGQPRFVAAEVQPLVADGGARKGVLLLARNISREKELASQLAQSERLKAMGEMVSGVAHELNNPLAGILGYAQLLLSTPTEDWSRRDVDMIEANARRCKKIVENLLAFARQSRSDRQSASLNEVIESVIALNEYQFRLDNVEMVRDFQPGLPGLPLDISRWQQVFINLAQNAREAMVEGASPVRRITFVTRLRGTAIEARVEDTGPGIPRPVLARVFDPFFTTRRRGTGLGLGLVYGIVTDHGGTIGVESEPGRGAVFTIRLPCGAPLEERPAPTVEEPRPASELAGTDLRVLVVDDEQVVRDVVTKVLELHGYEVDTAKDSSEAFGRIAASSYDAILTDVRMPGELDGFGMLQRLRQTHPSLAERVVFMTGVIDTDHPVVRDIQRLGLPYVNKPFDIRELARVVNGVTRSKARSPRPRPAAGA